jgi:dipeptidase D
MNQLQPTSIWTNFRNLNAIPRASKKEEQVIEFIKKFGEDLGLETIVDAIGNVLIKKSATSGMENKPTVIMQGHLDMVHQKNDDTDFDFATQGIQMYVEGDWVKAKGTTLGADNGIGVAAIMSVLAADDMKHPAIEALFTIDEEVGMTGAMGVKKDFLTGSVLLNLDSEEDDALTIGSAGGVDVEIDGSYELASISTEFTFFELIVKGLTGGHSGVDIHTGRSNAIKVLNRVLFELNKAFEIKIHSINGGSLTNAIPRECRAVIALKVGEVNDFENALADWNKQIKKENDFSDPSLNITTTAIENQSTVLTEAFQRQLIGSLYTCPNGIYRMTPSLNNLVQTSNNLAKITVENGAYKICCHTRSFIESERDDLVNVIRNSFLPIQATVTEVGPYPGWNPNPNTKTVATMKAIYQRLYGQAPDIFAIHAGLECGILSELYPDLEIISFGPNISGAHSPDEQLQISSTQKFWTYLTNVLAEI